MCPFFEARPSKLLSCASTALLVSLIALLAFTVLSRLGHFNFMGVSVVLSTSMEPTLRRGDFAVYFNANYTVGDIVVYCLTPSHCIVHRVVGFLRLDTTNGEKILILTKGDNVDTPDPPVDSEWVKGKVVFTVARELWIPLFVVLLAYALYDMAKTPVVGITITVVLAVGLTSVAALYATAPSPIALDFIEPPALRLAGVYFDPETCTVNIRYTGGLSLTGAVVKVNSTDVEIVYLGEREITLKPSSALLRLAFEQRAPLIIEVNAQLNHIGELSGEYALLVGGGNPIVSSVSNAALVRNVNCFPLSVNVCIRYLSGREWAWSNQTHTIEGFSYLVVEPPEGAEVAYAYFYWLNQGDIKWVGLPLKAR